MSDAEGFLARWSRRKRAAAAGAPPAEPAKPVSAEPAKPVSAEPPKPALAEPAKAVETPPGAPPVTPAPEAPAPVAAPTPAAPAEPEFDPASLPPVESLTAESDITPFLRPQVPAALRHAALRRAWTLDPAIREFIGPADYAWDYNAPGGVPGFRLDLGGDVKRLLAQAVGLAEEKEQQPPAPEAAPVPTPAAQAEEVPPPGPVAEDLPPALPAPVQPAEPAVPEAAEPPPLPPRRRHGRARPV